MIQTLIRVAENEAKKNYHGNTDLSIGNLQPIAELFEEVDEVTLETLDGDWSGAFAFLCVQKAGYGLPLRYPDPRVRGSFASVGAWMDYAKLPKIGIWHSPAEPIVPGDLVFFEVKPGKAPMMGIVLSIGEGDAEIAIGNYHGHSAVAVRPLDSGIEGFLRFKN